ncbi:MAG TPA: low specificity L-threonine aldolase, partial [Firmicutes bacterium]|nr:low specificity L-threonine aldolase [Bacillota bacterium]
LAKKLAYGLNRLGLNVNLDDVQTNMVLLSFKDADTLLLNLKKQNILAGLSRPGVIRFVTHLDISEEDIDYTLDTIRQLI